MLRGGTAASASTPQERPVVTAANFSAKIRTLTDYYQRALSNVQPPSGLDIVNTLRYFQQTLLGLMKDVQDVPLTHFESYRFEQERIALFPSLNFGGLFQAVKNLIDVFPNITSGQLALGNSLITTINHIYLFLDAAALESLHTDVAGLLHTFPSALHDDIINCLCNVILPFMLKHEDPDEENYVTDSLGSLLLTVFQYSNNPAHHSQVLECCMSLRKNVYKHVVSVVAYGTPEARVPAANLLFHYWPFLNPNVFDRRTSQYRPSGWTPVKCYHKNCQSQTQSFATKRCMNPLLCAEFADACPPIFLCESCAAPAVAAAEAIEAPEGDILKSSVADCCMPMQTVSTVCQNRGCGRLAVSTCFAQECIELNHMRPIRLCQECDDRMHPLSLPAPHVFHPRLPSPWDCEPELSHSFIRAVVSLLLECASSVDLLQDDRPRWLQQLEGEKMSKEQVDEARMLSRYGIWMLVGLCTPRDDSPDDAVAQLLGVLVHWFAVTALLPNDGTGRALEQLKNDFVCDWLPGVVKRHFDVFVEVLLPKPPENARLGPVWDRLSTRIEQLKDGLSCLLALIPYDIITLEAWDRLMPYWMEAISVDVEPRRLPELKVLLCKIFELDMCSLPFGPDGIYGFIGCRLRHSNYLVQRQAADWMQILSGADIMIPLDILLPFFVDAVRCVRHPSEVDPALTEMLYIPFEAVSENEQLERVAQLMDHTDGQSADGSGPGSPIGASEPAAESDSNAELFVAMGDVVIKQMELLEIRAHRGADTETAQQLLRVVAELVRGPWHGTHTCEDPELDEFVDCSLCRNMCMFSQVVLDVIKHICPRDQVRIEVHPDVEMESLWEDSTPTTVAAAGDTLVTEVLVSESQQTPEDHVDGDSILSPGGGRYHLARVKDTMDELECVDVLPYEQIETGLAQAVDVGETDVAAAHADITSAVLSSSTTPTTPAGPKFWVTSQGNFRFALEELPGQLQIIYAIMKDIELLPDPDVRCFLLHCMQRVCLHAEALNDARSNHFGFLIWAQENLLIPKLWSLLQAQYSHVSKMCVPLILHCLTQPVGPDIFWKVVSDDFCKIDWKDRFVAVERFTVLARFLDPVPVRVSPALQACLANGFCYLIASAYDPNCATSQRTMLYMETIPLTALKCLVACLESQFDAVIVDRPLIIHRLYLLTNLLENHNILSWDFFLARFDTLTMEAQVQLEKSGDIPMAQDLMHSDPTSDVYLRKIARAQAALDPDSTVTVRSIASTMKNALDFQRSVDISAVSKTSKNVVRLSDAFIDPTPKVDPPSRRASSVHAVRGRQKMRKVLLLVKAAKAFRQLNRSVTSARNSIENLTSIMFAAQAAPAVHLARPGSSMGRFRHSSADSNSGSSVGSLRSAKSECQPTTSSGLYKIDFFNTIRGSCANLVGAVGSVATMEVCGTDGGGSTAQGRNERSSSQPRSSRSSHASLEPATALGKLREFTDEESNWALMLNKSLDLENPQRHTMFLIVNLFMKFLSTPNTTMTNPDEKAVAKKQSIVFRHLNVLLGYNTTDKCFTVPPFRLRCSAVANAFLSALPEVLDRNVFVGTQLLPTAANLLQFLPSPQRYASDNQPSNYSIWLLEPVVRVQWLWSVLLILYKYRFDQPPISDFALRLLQLVINTLDEHMHRCVQIESNNISSPLFPRSRGLATDRPRMAMPNSPSRRLHTLRRVFTTVLLMVRVMRVWPRGADSIGSSLAGGRPPFLLGSTTSSFDDEDQEAESSSASDSEFDATSAGTAEGKASAGAHHRRRLMSNNRKPTFDEREEHVLEQVPEHQSPAPVETHMAAQLEAFEETASEMIVGPVSPADVCSPPGVKTVKVVAPVAEAIEPESSQVPSTAPTPKINKSLLSVPPASAHATRTTDHAAERYEFPLMDDPTVFGPLCAGAVRFADATVHHRCTQCNAPLRKFDEEACGLAIVCLSTFVQREPGMAASMLENMLEVVSRLANSVSYPWQGEVSLFVPGNCRSVARQFLRVTLHQYATNRLFLELFQSDATTDDFLRAISSCLCDFTELNPVAFLEVLIKDMNETGNRQSQVFYNVARYMHYLQGDAYSPAWQNVATQLDAYLRHYNTEVTEVPPDVAPFLCDIFIAILKVNTISSFKNSISLLESIAKLLSIIINSAPISLESLLTLCTACNRAFQKERDKLMLSRAVVTEFVNALKFKTSLPEKNYLVIVEFLLQDAGEYVNSTVEASSHLYNTGAAEAVRPYLQEFFDFVGDLHVLNKIKSVCKGATEDTLGGELKALLSRYAAVEIARSMGGNSRFVTRFVPWLYHPPSVTQQGPNEFVECVARIRLLSWLLLGSLLHRPGVGASSDCLVVPLDAAHAITDHIQFVLAGFAEQSKESVLHMSSLFHTFHLCQLWTIYCEQAQERWSERVTQHKPSTVEAKTVPDDSGGTVDFWARITPAILQLLSHSKVLADMVNLHFLNTVEALHQCNSSVLSKLRPMWQPMMLAHQGQVPSQLMVRLDAVENQVPSGVDQLHSWLRAIQTKISKIELQSAVATHFLSA